MTKKLYLFAFGFLTAIVFIFVGIMFANWKTTDSNAHIYPTQTPSYQSSYTIEDSSFAPKSKSAMANGEIIRETQNGKLQQFVIKSSIDGSMRELFSVDADDITFEKITYQNWSPTNKFLFVYIDYPNRRDVLFIKTDGKFTNGSYYLHSTGLYPTMNVQSAKWLDGQTLALQSKDIKTNLQQTYLVSFDDDSGIVTPENK